MIFERYAVVVVPFPFTDRAAGKRRPALVISDPRVFGTPTGGSVLAMITRAKSEPWPLDVPIGNLAAAGLPAPSVVRFKLFTLAHELIERQAGVLPVLGSSSAGSTQRRGRRLHCQAARHALSCS